MDELVIALQQGITPAIIVGIYLIATRFLDNKKEMSQAKLSEQLVKSVNDISTFLNDITRNIIEKDKDKCRCAIKDSMTASACRIINFAISTIINNHVEANRESVNANIKNIVNTEYYTVHAALSLYKINGVKASEHLNKEWMDIVEKDLKDYIFNKEVSKEDRIDMFQKRISIKFQSYSTFVINKTIK